MAYANLCVDSDDFSDKDSHEDIYDAESRILNLGFVKDQRVVSDAELSDCEPPRRWFGCLPCGKWRTFKNKHYENPKSKITSTGKKPKVKIDKHLSPVFKVYEYLSQDVELEIDRPNDSLICALLYSSLTSNRSGFNSTFNDADWSALGFSFADINFLYRDFNRQGGCMLAVLSMLYMALEHNTLAKTCVQILRNVHLKPAELFGLFAINCCKWTLDFVRENQSQVCLKQVLENIKTSDCTSDNKFTKVLDWWLRADNNVHTKVEDERFVLNEVDIPGPSYVELAEDVDIIHGIVRQESDLSSSLGEGYVGDTGGKSTSSRKLRSVFCKTSASSPGTLNLGRHLSSVSSSDNILSFQNLDFWKKKKFWIDPLVVFGEIYSLFMARFADWWIKEGLVTAHTTDYHLKLNNFFLQSEFVDKLEIPFEVKSLNDMFVKTEEMSSMLMNKLAYKLQSVISVARKQGFSFAVNSRENLIASVQSCASFEAQNNFSQIALSARVRELVEEHHKCRYPRKSSSEEHLLGDVSENESESFEDLSAKKTSRTNMALLSKDKAASRIMPNFYTEACRREARANMNRSVENSSNKIHPFSRGNYKTSHEKAEGWNQIYGSSSLRTQDHNISPDDITHRNYGCARSSSMSKHSPDSLLYLSPSRVKTQNPAISSSVTSAYRRKSTADLWNI